MRYEFYFSAIFISIISKSLSELIQSLFNLVLIKFPCPWNKWHNLRLIKILDINVYLQITAVVEYIFSLIIKYNTLKLAKVKLCAIQFSWRTYTHYMYMYVYVPVMFCFNSRLRNYHKCLEKGFLEGCESQLYLKWLLCYILECLHLISPAM